MAYITRKKNVNISRVVAKLTVTIISLWVGGTIVNEIGAVMNCTSSPFYTGLSLIGWTITSDGTTFNATGCPTAASENFSAVGETITSTSGTGILSVIGIVGLASIVLEFVSFKM